MATPSYRERLKAARAEASAKRKAEQAARQRQIELRCEVHRLALAAVKADIQAKGKRKLSTYSRAELTMMANALIAPRFIEQVRAKIAKRTGHSLSQSAISLRPVRRPNADYRVREHLTEREIDRLLAVLKGNRHGPRDWLIGLMIYRHGLRVSEACDLRWDDIDIAAADNRHQKAEGIEGQHSLPRTRRTQRARSIAAPVGVCLRRRARPTLRAYGHRPAD